MPAGSLLFATDWLKRSSRLPRLIMGWTPSHAKNQKTEIGWHPNFEGDVPLGFLANNIARDGLERPTKSRAIHLHLFKCKFVQPETI